VTAGENQLRGLAQEKLPSYQWEFDEQVAAVAAESFQEAQMKQTAS
jgi:hypothetical protein